MLPQSKSMEGYSGTAKFSTFLLLLAHAKTLEAALLRIPKHCTQILI
jgi:hypothetical protein